MNTRPAISRQSSNFASQREDNEEQKNELAMQGRRKFAQARNTRGIKESSLNNQKKSLK